MAFALLQFMLVAFVICFMISHIPPSNGNFYTDTVKRTHPNSKLPSPKDYDKTPTLSDKEETENRKILVIHHGSDEDDYGQPPLKSIPIVSCNSSLQLNKSGEWFRIQSKGFGNPKGNYFPGEYCYWKFIGRKAVCIPEIKCDKSDLRGVNDEFVEITDARLGKIVLFGADHFHDLKKAHDHKGLIVKFHASSSQKRRRHFDGFMCVVTCNRACSNDLDASTCPYSIVEPAKPHCNNPIPPHDCEREPTSVSLLTEQKPECNQVIVIPLKQGANKTRMEITITLPKEKKPKKLDLYILYDATMSPTWFPNTKNNLPQLVDVAKKLSSDTFIGFGTYSDKYDRAVSRTAGLTGTYSFIHTVNFKTASTVLADLQKAVDDIDTVDDKGNDRETVEDSLSGIHQAIVCGNRLGWRPNSKKIIVTFTDSMFHLNWEKAKGLGYEDFNPERCYINDHDKNRLLFKGDRINYPKPEDVVKQLKKAGVSLLLSLLDIGNKDFPQTKAAWENQILHPIKPNYGFATTNKDDKLVELISQESTKILQSSQEHLQLHGRNISQEILHLHGVETIDGNDILKCEEPKTDGHGKRTTKCIFEAELAACPRKRPANKFDLPMQVFLEGYDKPIATFHFDLYCEHKKAGGLHD